MLSTMWNFRGSIDGVRYWPVQEQPNLERREKEKELDWHLIFRVRKT
jgi:hypothetical protein